MDTISTKLQPNKFFAELDKCSERNPYTSKIYDTL